MRVYLEKRLRRPVLFITAPDYLTFHRRTQNREYAYVITVANAAYLAQFDAGYQPLLRPTIYTRPTLVVARDAPIGNVSDLRGRVISLPDPLAIVAMQALPMLREAGLEPERDVTLKHLPSHSAALNYVLSGEVAAAIVSDQALKQSPAAVRDALRVVQSWDRGAAPGVVYLANPALPHGEAQRLARAILDYVADAEGKALMDELGYGTLVPMKPDDLKLVAPYAAALKAALAQAAAR